jgi:hypothetical protein
MHNRLYTSPFALYRVEDDDQEWWDLAEDCQAWRWWTGGDGSGNLAQRVKRPGWKYKSYNNQLGLWLEAEGSSGQMALVFKSGFSRRKMLDVIDTVVKASWVMGFRTIKCELALTEVNALILYSRAMFFTPLSFSLDQENPSIPSTEVTLTRYNPEIVHEEGGIAW